MDSQLPAYLTILVGVVLLVACLLFYDSEYFKYLIFIMSSLAGLLMVYLIIKSER